MYDCFGCSNCQIGPYQTNISQIMIYKYIQYGLSYFWSIHTPKFLTLELAFMLAPPTQIESNNILYLCLLVPTIKNYVLSSFIWSLFLLIQSLISPIHSWSCIIPNCWKKILVEHNISMIYHVILCLLCDIYHTIRDSPG